MYKIVSKEMLTPVVCRMVVEAPRLSAAAQPGQFLIVRADEKGERIPLTIADSDIEKGTITLVIQQIGASTHKICAMEPGDALLDVVGPLGKATQIDHFGTVICACGGVGAAPMLPIAHALKEAGNKVITVLAARTKELIILEEELAIDILEVFFCDLKKHTWNFCEENFHDVDFTVLNLSYRVQVEFDS